MIQIIPTLFAKTEKAFADRLKKLTNSESFQNGWVQIDFMDNKFVQNQSVSVDVIKNYPIYYKKEVQLMVIDPLAYIDQFLDISPDRIIFPLEIEKDVETIIKYIRSKGLEVGLSVNPETSIAKIVKYMIHLDAVLLMGVTPGREGQQLSPEITSKIEYIKSKDWDLLVGVDGGVKDTNVIDLVEAGADYLAIGSFLFEGDIDENLEKIWEKLNQ